MTGRPTYHAAKSANAIIPMRCMRASAPWRPISGLSRGGMLERTVLQHLPSTLKRLLQPVGGHFSGQVATGRGTRTHRFPAALPRELPCAREIVIHFQQYDMLHTTSLEERGERSAPLAPGMVQQRLAVVQEQVPHH